MQPINRVDDAQAQLLRDIMSGKSPPKNTKRKPRVAAAPTMFLPQYTNVQPRLIVCQMAVRFDDRMWHENTTRWTRKAVKDKERDGTIAFMLSRLPLFVADAGARERVRHIDFVRIGPGKLARHDNLRTAFKYVVDATCGVVLWGHEVLKRKRYRIGAADDVLEEQGMTWNYLQHKAKEQPRAYAVQVRFHLGDSPRLSGG